MRPLEPITYGAGLSMSCDQIPNELIEEETVVITKKKDFKPENQ